MNDQLLEINARLVQVSTAIQLAFGTHIQTHDPAMLSDADAVILVTEWRFLLKAKKALLSNDEDDDVPADQPRGPEAMPG